MLRAASIRNKNISIGIIISIVLIIESLFLVLDDNIHVVFLTVGVTAGFIVSFGNKVIPGIIISLFVTGVILYIFHFGYDFKMATTLALSITFVSLVGGFIFSTLLKNFECTIPITFKTAFYHISVMIVTSTLTAIVPSLQLAISNQTDYFVEIFNVARPIFLGLAIMATPIIFSNFYDYEFKFLINNPLRDFVFIIVFTVLTYFVFSNSIIYMDFSYWGFIFIILYLINAGVFNYRMLIYMNIVYITFYNIFSDMDVFHGSLTTHTTLINTYLFVLVLITIFYKVLLHSLHEKNSVLNNTNKRLEDMIESTISLIKVKDTLQVNDSSYMNNYMRDIFQISLKIFEQFEYAICVIKTNDIIEVVDTIGYDIDLIRNMQIKSSSILWKKGGPIISESNEEFFERLLGERFNLYKDSLPEVTQSARIVIQIDKNNFGGIIFNVPQNKPKMPQSDYENLAAFQKLINSFYEMNELSIKNNNLKDDIVFSLIRTLELFDHYTGGHSEEVADLSLLLAEELKLDKDEKYNIYWAGIVHDIGKIGIDSKIINKEGRLTLDEYKEVKKHPIYGYNILRKSQDLTHIALLVKHHHEWWNGSGYPDGLKQNKIPIGSQILQIADSVSAMAKQRVYSDAKTCEEIIEEIEMYKGTQFSPIIADLMIKLIENKKISQYYESRRKL